MDFKGEIMLVMNPKSGRKKSEKTLPEVCEALFSSGWKVTVFPTGKKGDGYEFVKEFGASYDRIVAMGGDGTLNEIVSGMMDAGLDVPVGYIPAGSTNDYATTHGIPTSAIEAAEVAGGDSIKSVDVARFGSSYAAFHAACGPFGAIVNSTPQDIKNQMGYVAYVLDGLKDAASSSLKPVRVRFILDSGEVLEDDYIYGGIINTGCLGGGIINLPETELDDGRFELFLIKGPGDLYEVGELVTALITSSFDDSPFTLRRFSSCRIESDGNANWCLDGEEYSGPNSIDVCVIEKALKLCKP